jgi:hypothetical protein
VLPACRLVEYINADPHVTDLRWAAYMLATAMWETTTLIEERRQVIGRNGKPALDAAGKAVYVASRHWEAAMSAVSEVGRGITMLYGSPVKVHMQVDGSASITEEDGDQFTVLPTGNWLRKSKLATAGVQPGTPRSKVYDEADGTALHYYGRGYVQLSWWHLYAKAGVAIGRGLDLLRDPELANDPDIAYEVMSRCMRTGAAFANGLRLGDYLNGSRTDYVNARRTMNGLDKAQPIAALAQKFQTILIRSAPSVSFPALQTAP